jgi:hypothetical protein
MYRAPLPRQCVICRAASAVVDVPATNRNKGRAADCAAAIAAQGADIHSLLQAARVDRRPTEFQHDHGYCAAGRGGRMERAGRRMVLVGATALVGAMALALAGCRLADSRSPLPDFLRAKEADPPPLEARPDVGALVSKELDVIFLPSSYPHDLRVSQPHHDLRSNAWIACVRAELTSATGCRWDRRSIASRSRTAKSRIAAGSRMRTIVPSNTTRRSLRQNEPDAPAQSPARNYFLSLSNPNNLVQQ